MIRCPKCKAPIDKWIVLEISIERYSCTCTYCDYAFRVKEDEVKEFNLQQKHEDELIYLLGD